ncbi:hypothetical protein C2869_10665 [Saccharobesus litoralis]|uniref:DUF4760 domain-containing protein n=1 Tax=Saccharobesus litoralis TaxID=2172099 RepID=A0A2S0VRM2_9ALTE|nr:DUF4760 domain-containing protein [Saccharobesus litoralis]AWB66866.1 hypothetical protein C2869_10665 [Saccharobesus litoralis]
MEDHYTISDTINSIIKREANFFNYTSIAISLLIATFACGANGHSEGFYADNKLIFWIASYLFFFIGVFVPLNKAKFLPYGKRFFWGGFGVLGLALLFLVVAIWQSAIPQGGASKMNSEAIDLLGYTSAGALVILGWFVQHQLTRQHNKTNHSLNVLLQMRVSEEFQEQTRLANRYYPSRSHTTISKEDVETYHSSNTVLSNTDLTDTQKKIQSISAHSYLLNYYEFLAYGIKSGVLDEELLFQTIGAVVIGHYQRAEQIVSYARNKSKKTFSNLVELEERWKERRDFDCLQLDKKQKNKRG